MSTSADALSPRAEAFDAYRWAHLLIVAAAHSDSTRKNPLTLDRLATYDFFAAHPFLVFDSESERGRRLIREGLEPRSLTYAAAPDRLANRRQRIQADVNALVARELVELAAEGGRLVVQLTENGTARAAELGSLYAQAVRESATLIMAQLERLADATLRSRATEWTNHRALMIDVLEAE